MIARRTNPDELCVVFLIVFIQYFVRSSDKRLVSQMRAPLAASREPAGKLWQLCQVLYIFEHKMQYLLIHASFTRIAVFWHIDNKSPMISKSNLL